METKICPRCGTDQPKSCFNVVKRILKSGKRAYRPYCRSCNSIRQKKYKKKIVERNRKWINEYKKNISCVICGEDEPYCLDFHHIKPKHTYIDKPIFRLHTTYSIETLEKKLENCVVVCSNCHRKIHDAVRVICKIAGCLVPLLLLRIKL